MIMTGYVQISLKDMLDQFGDDQSVKKILSEFSCPLNADVERFLKNSAIEFAKQSIAPTYLVFSSYKGNSVLVGYYTLCTKTIQVERKSISNNLAKRLKKFAAFDPENKNYMIVSPLIAQLGKNFSNSYNELITGDDLLYMAISRVKEAQMILGGKVVYLECEDKPRLLEFYRSHGFVDFNKRMLDRDETETLQGQYLIQLLRYLD